jgi:hypothetical protein
MTVLSTETSHAILWCAPQQMQIIFIPGRLKIDPAAERSRLVRKIQSLDGWKAATVGLARWMLYAPPGTDLKQIGPPSD